MRFLSFKLTHLLTVFDTPYFAQKYTYGQPLLHLQLRLLVIIISTRI